MPPAPRAFLCLLRPIAAVSLRRPLPPLPCRYLGVILLGIVLAWLHAARSLNEQFVVLAEETGVVAEL